jgi:hypothetical protein
MVLIFGVFKPDDACYCPTGGIAYAESLINLQNYFPDSFRSISKVLVNSLLLSVRQKFLTSLTGYDRIFGKKKSAGPPMPLMQ